MTGGGYSFAAPWCPEWCLWAGSCSTKNAAFPVLKGVERGGPRSSSLLSNLVGNWRGRVSILLVTGE